MKKILILLVFLIYMQQLNAQSIRKNYLEMTAQEQNDYVDGLAALYANDFIPEVAEHHGEHFCTNIHTGLSINGENFLPWHRFFLLDFEENLRQTKNASNISNAYLSIPYWDWRDDPQHGAAGSPINLSLSPNFWGYSTILGGTPSFLALSKFPGWSVATHMECNTQVAGSNLTRNINLAHSNFGTLPQALDITNLLNLTTFFNSNVTSTSTSSTDFSHRMEAWHNKAHVWVGGTMRSGSSPLDPAFVLHHSMIDKLWYDKEERQAGIFSMFPQGTAIMPHYDGVHDPGGNIVLANSMVNSRSEQRPNISGPGRAMDVWYAEKGKVLLDGANGSSFLANDISTPYIYRYTAALTPGVATPNSITGEIYVGDVQRDPNNFNNVILDNKGGFVVNNNVTCDFKSGGAVVFMPGFESNYSSVMTAKIITNPSAMRIIRPDDPITSTTDKVTSFQCYPNPVNDVLTISNSNLLDQKMIVQVISVDGKLIRTVSIPSFNAKSEIDVQDLKPGLYFARIITDEKQEILKFQK